MELTAQNVENVFMGCLFKDNEPKDNPVIADGVMVKVGFNPERLKEKSADILEMLKQLPQDFLESAGGGMSFLNACMDSSDQQWGEHRNIEQLLCLGIAAGYAKILFPRSMWSLFPGGMPYFVVLNRQSPTFQQLEYSPKK